MDFRLSDEEEELRREVEGFVREELIPEEVLFDGAPDSRRSRWLQGISL